MRGDCRRLDLGWRIFQRQRDVREFLQLAAEIGPVVGAYGLDEAVLGLAPSGEAGSEGALAFGSQREETLASGGAIGDREEALFLKET